MVYWCLSESANLILSRCGWNLQQVEALCLLSGSVFIIDGSHSEWVHNVPRVVLDGGELQCDSTYFQLFDYIYVAPINIPVIPLTSENYVLAYNYAPPP